MLALYRSAGRRTRSRPSGGRGGSRDEELGPEAGGELRRLEQAILRQTARAAGRSLRDAELFDRAERAVSA